MVSGGYGPVASIPSARSASMAGAMMRSSSSPMLPPSPACGFNPATAKRGRAMPKRSRSAAAATCAACRMASVLRASKARRSERWTVAGTTRRWWFANIITGRAQPVSAPRNSVWPGCGKPAP